MNFIDGIRRHAFPDKLIIFLRYHYAELSFVARRVHHFSPHNIHHANGAITCHPELCVGIKIGVQLQLINPDAL
jgi:hypothetical protein